MDLWAKYFGRRDESRDDFFARHGIVELEYQDNLDLVRERYASIGLDPSKESNYGELSHARFPPFGIYNAGNRVDVKDLYSLNSYGLRSDEFISEHDGKHVLFAGCSITAGDSLQESLIWSRKLYSKISETEKLSGYFNVGLCGGSISDIITQITSYVNEFGSPDVIFVNLPDLLRENENGSDLRESLRFIWNQYNLLHNYCNSAAITLIAISWSEMINMDTSIGYKDIFDLPSPFKNAPSSFYKFTPDDRHRHMQEYAINNSDNVPEELMLVALDYVHPGAAEHDFYFNYMYNIYSKGSQP